MSTICEGIIGEKLPIDHSGVISCVIYENSGFVPYGQITFLDKLHYFDDDFDFQTYSKFTATISNLEDGIKKPYISFTGDIIYSSFKRSPENQKMMIVDLTFIYRGENSKFFAALEPTCLASMNSVSAIKQLCKTAGIKFTATDVKPNDNMNWLIVNHNFLSAVNFICDRSYTENDSLMYSIRLDGTFMVNSPVTSFAQDPVAKFVPYNKMDIVNDNSSGYLYYFDSHVENSSGIMQESFSTAVKSAYPDASKNKVVSKNKGIVPGGDGGSRGASIPNNTIYSPQKSPQTHENYGLAPEYNKAILGSYSRSIVLSCINEATSKVNDTVEIIDGIYDGEHFVKSNLTSGKYFINKKAYHFNMDGVSRNLITLIQATKDKTIYKNKVAESIRSKT